MEASLSRALCALVALAAGIVGTIMLVAPGSTDRYFSWGISPPSLAALVGGFYVASALVFGWAARGSWRGQRGLCVAVFGLTLPTLVATLHHRQVFDFDRWQAVLWLVLFVASPLLFGLALLLARRAGPTAPTDAPRLPPWARALLAATAAAYGGLALLLWLAPDAVSRSGPIEAGPMGIRFVGAWAAFLGVLASYAAARARWDEARLPVVALVAWPLAGLAAALTRLDQLGSGAPRAVYLTGLLALAIPAACVLARGQTRGVDDQAGRAVSSSSRRLALASNGTAPWASATATAVAAAAAAPDRSPCDASSPARSRWSSAS
jgi:hypothetical protein